MLISRMKKWTERIICINYRRTIPQKVNAIRKKDKIKVLFILAETSKWKTELLYQAMLNHERFDPIIGITLKTDDKPSESARKLLQLVSYLKNKRYDYQELIREDYIQTQIAPDIIIYQEPYYSTILRGFSYLHQLNSLFISITYGFHSVLLPFNNMGGLKDFAWFDCYENESTAHDAREYINGKRNNIVTTGLPMSEALLKYSKKENVWKENGKKKKIIWAPHHSIGFDYETICYGNFLNIAEYMIEISTKLQDKIQWAFKPHPLLRYKLELVWGKERTNQYYSYWKDNDYTQLEEDEYIDLFMQSDAMIHDCDTFTIEYLYANKPVLFLYNSKRSYDHLNHFAQEALNVHYKGIDTNDIDRFVNALINEEDVLFEKRNLFYEENLKTTMGKNASENIIHYILGEEL